LQRQAAVNFEMTKDINFFKFPLQMRAKMPQVAFLRQRVIDFETR
jgi:hypothetical protein